MQEPNSTGLQPEQPASEGSEGPELTSEQHTDQAQGLSEPDPSESAEVVSVPEEVSESDTASEAEPEGTDKKKWYVLKVQSNREDRIRESLERRVAIEGVQDLFGDIIVPTERVSEIKAGKKRVSERKLYPGYLMINMVDPTLQENEAAWFLVRETSGIGDFTGAAGKPVPMEPHEVERMLGRETSKQEEQPRLKIDFQPGEQVKVKEGTFENFEGSVDAVDEANGRVTVMINIFGRSTPVELEYWQVEAV